MAKAMVCALVAFVSLVLAMFYTHHRDQRIALETELVTLAEQMCGNDGPVRTIETERTPSGLRVQANCESGYKPHTYLRP